MLNSDVLRRICYALKLSDRSMLELFQLGGIVMDPDMLLRHLKREEEEGYAPLGDRNMAAFLDGLILKHRGARENTGTAPVKREHLNNNLVLRKMKIALELRDDDLLAILKRSEMEVSKSELSALFRQRNHKNYKQCGDQILRNFLAGLAGYKKSASPVEAAAPDSPAKPGPTAKAK